MTQRMMETCAEGQFAAKLDKGEFSAEGVADFLLGCSEECASLNFSQILLGLRGESKLSQTNQHSESGGSENRDQPASNNESIFSLTTYVSGKFTVCFVCFHDNRLQVTGFLSLCCC